MIVGARIGVAASRRRAGQLGCDAVVRVDRRLAPTDPFRKITFICALGMIMGAAIVDMSMLAGSAIKQFGQTKAAVPEEDWRRTDKRFLSGWVAFWALAVLAMGVGVLHLPVAFVVIAIALAFVFLMVNGISLGISDSNPISSAFVLTVFILAAIGMKDPVTGLLCASILLIATATGGDMQQDRSTGWRLGTNRTIQFRYQVVGIAMGAVMSVGAGAAVHEGLSDPEREPVRDSGGRPVRRSGSRR